MATKLMNIDPEVVSGTPVFAGTRVPVETLFDYLAAGDSLDRFLDGFPSVKHEQAVAVLRESARLIVKRASSTDGMTDL